MWVGFIAVGVAWAGGCRPRGPTRIQGEPGVLGRVVFVAGRLVRPLVSGRVGWGGGWKGVGVAVVVVRVGAVVMAVRRVVGICVRGSGARAGWGVDQRLGWGVGVVFGV